VAQDPGAVDHCFIPVLGVAIPDWRRPGDEVATAWSGTIANRKSQVRNLVVFSSYLFLFYFLPVALGLYSAGRRRWKHLVLTLCSYVFYGWANPWFVFLMFFSTVIDYVGGLIVTGRIGGSPPSTRQRRFAVALSVTMNLSLLGFFKYFGFAQENVNWFLRMFGHDALRVYQVVLPVGISFYTFQSMSYCIDLYRSDARPAPSFLDFACYVAMYPQLVAGPIVRYHEIAEQLRERSHTVDKFARGVFFFSLGFAKKILLANPMGEVADAAFRAGALHWHQAWAGVLGYAFQIYFDFSGYSDMAVGLGLMLGFEFARNFNYPYLADSITDFWRRWHISLSTWLRDYLYIPLGGNRLGVGRTYLNLALVMLLGGMWHGAEWTFIVWGAIHGSMLIVERLIGKNPLYRGAPGGLRIGLTFVVVLFTWVFFRADGVTNAFHYVGAMFGSGAPPVATLLNAVLYSPDHLLGFAVCAAVTWACPDTWELARRVGTRKMVAALALLFVAAAVMFTQTYNPFLYFRF